ncbi:hypothetical protein B0T19DRAFT_484031 [Cercophora scortea]|uniref:Uncharacterized protein n=1 Tax=Cercophora scortea TaxID=314031 RepID=A0AAE0IZZ0_9PEZI|nr:hypothetical protein B0T19DRAFT_484031 [Cercophora scortea]
MPHGLVLPWVPTHPCVVCVPLALQVFLRILANVGKRPQSVHVSCSVAFIFDKSPPQPDPRIPSPHNSKLPKRFLALPRVLIINNSFWTELKLIGSDPDLSVANI